MGEIITVNSTVGALCFFILYPIYKKLCNGFWDYTKVVVPIMILYYILYFGCVMAISVDVPTNHLWCPYVFGGMPAYGVGFIGIRWWNHIDIFVNSLRTVLDMNPISALLLFGSIYWLYQRAKNHKKILWNYFLIVLSELMVIFLTTWR